MDINEELVAYCRIFLPGDKYDYPYASIGRVVVSPQYRSKGIGVALMRKALEFTDADQR
jgi:ElaA protein